MRSKPPPCSRRRSRSARRGNPTVMVGFNPTTSGQWDKDGRVKPDHDGMKMVYVANPRNVPGIFCTASITPRRVEAFVPGAKSIETVSTIPP